MDVLIVTLELAPLLVSILLCSMFFSRLLKNYNGHHIPGTFLARVTEVCDDGNIIVSDNWSLSDEVVPVNDKNKSFKLGQAVRVKRHGATWILSE